MAAPLRPGCAAGWCRRVTEVPLATVEVYDATVFSASRTAFLGAWIGSPGHIGRALVRDGGPAGWGVTGPCRKGRKIGPLVADDRATAEVVLSALTFLALTAMQSRWRKTWGSPRCSRLRACIEADLAVAVGAGIRRHCL